MAKYWTRLSVECKCDHSFTCGFCLRNAPPAIFTPTPTEFYFSSATEARNKKEE